MEMTTKRWILMGVGVFAVMAMCAGGIGALFYGGYSMVADNDAFHAAKAHATTSADVQARVGTVRDVDIDWSGGTSVHSSSNNGVKTGAARYSLKITGARGTVPACAVLELTGEAWRIEDFVVGQPCSASEADVELEDAI